MRGLDRYPFGAAEIGIGRPSHRIGIDRRFLAEFHGFRQAESRHLRRDFSEPAVAELTVAGVALQEVHDRETGSLRIPPRQNDIARVAANDVVTKLV
jgi:hypothetical protein